MMKPLLAAVLSVSVTLGTFGTASAAPFRTAPLAGNADLATEVQFRDRRRLRREIRRERRLRRDRRYLRDLRRDRRRTDRRLRRQRGTAAIGGVIGGLALGAIIANSRRNAEPRRVYRAPRYRFSPAHHGWCSDRYRSYRSSDGTFQPYNGSRRLCRSPYL